MIICSLNQRCSTETLLEFSYKNVLWKTGSCPSIWLQSITWWKHRKGAETDTVTLESWFLSQILCLQIIHIILLRIFFFFLLIHSCTLRPSTFSIYRFLGWERSPIKYGSYCHLAYRFLGLRQVKLPLPQSGLVQNYIL